MYEARQNKVPTSRTLSLSDYKGVRQFYNKQYLRIVSENDRLDNRMTQKKIIQCLPFRKGRSVGIFGNNYLWESTLPERVGPSFYFRAVTLQEFKELQISNMFSRQNSYQGITQDVNYVASPTYFGLNKNHHIIEFQIIPEINLEEEMQKAGTGKKNENGTWSFGLGYTATPANSMDRANGGDYFMYCMNAKCIRWRLTRYIGQQVPHVYRG